MHIIGHLCMWTKLNKQTKKLFFLSYFLFFLSISRFFPIDAEFAWDDVFPFKDVNAICFWAVVVIHNQHNIVYAVINIAMVYVKRGHCCSVMRFARFYRLLCKLEYRDTVFEEYNRETNTVLIFVVSRQAYHMFNTKSFFFTRG